jgi:hypothetical protein
VAFDYSDSCVLWTYRALDRPLNPTLQDLEDWDAQLLRRYENPNRQWSLVTIMTGKGVPVTPETKSWIVALARVTKRTTISGEIEAACDYYLNVTNLPLSSQQLSAVVVTGSRVKRRRPTPKAKKARKKVARKK